MKDLRENIPHTTLKQKDKKEKYNDFFQSNSQKKQKILKIDKEFLINHFEAQTNSSDIHYPSRRS